MNHSKTRNPQSWRKWYLSGAVQQPTLPPGGLVIDAIASHLTGPAASYSTLSLARPQDYRGSHSYSPVAHVIVPSGNKLALGKTLNRLPGNAAPINLFFPETDSSRGTATTDRLPITKSCTRRVAFRHRRHSEQYTIVERAGGWNQKQIELFINGGVECETLRQLPNRLVISAAVDNDEIASILGDNNFSARHVPYDQRWQ